MRFIPSRFPILIRTVALAAFLAMAAPAPAYADISLGSLLNGLLTGIGGFFSSLVNSLTGMFDKSTTGTIQALQTLYEGQRRLAQWQVQETYRGQLGQTLATASLYYQPVTDYACAVSSDLRSETGRVRSEDAIEEYVEKIVTRVVDNPNAGTAITKDQMQTLFCQLGASGKDPPKCNVDAVPKVDGGDLSFDIAIANKWCIPFDIQKLNAEVTRALPNPGGYTPSDEMREAFVAVLYLRRMVGAQCPLASGARRETLRGIEAREELENTFTSRLAKNPAILEVFEYVTCPSQTMLPNCRRNDENLIKYLTETHAPSPANQSTFMPGDTYCLSRRLMDHARTIRDMRALQDPPAGTDAEKTAWIARLEAEISDRREYYSELKSEASTAAAASMTENACPGTDRPVRTGTEYDMKELLDSVRSLTKALQQQNEKRSRALEVRSRRFQGEVRPGNVGALPPLRQEFETLK
jgi:hypothetical protein